MTLRNEDYKIRGRKSYRNKTSEIYEDQLNVCHNPQLNEREESSHSHHLDEDEESSACEQNSDEHDFSSHQNDQQSGLHVSTSQECFLISNKTHPKTHQPIKEANWKRRIIIFSLIAILCVVPILPWWSPANEVRVEISHSLQFSKDLKTLGKKFNLPRDFLQKIQVGMKTIHDAQSTGSFTILYDSGASNFIKSKFNELLENIAKATAKYLRKGNESFIDLESNNLKQANHEELMFSYDSLLLDKGVMMVKELDSLPTKLAMAFHYFCDEFNPLVKTSAIFFTIDKQKCSIHSSTEPHKWIEKCLANKWRHMQADFISPLLARVIDVVLEI